MSDIQTLLSIFKDHTSIVNTLWGILSTVALALLGFVYKEPELRRSPLILAILTIGFLALAAGNQVAIVRSQRILVGVTEAFHDKEFIEAAKLSPSMKRVLAVHNVQTVFWIRVTHTSFDILVIAALWISYVRMNG